MASSSSSLPPLIDRGGELVWHFYAKQCRYSFQHPHSSDPSSVLCSVAFRTSFIRSLLLYLKPHVENGSDGMLKVFYKQVARELAPKLPTIDLSRLLPFCQRYLRRLWLRS